MKCVPKSSVIFDNLPSTLRSTIERTSPDPLFCVHFDRSPVEGKFYNRIADLSKLDIGKIISREKEAFNKRLTSFGEAYDARRSQTRPKTHFSVGDVIPIAIAGSLERTTPEYLQLPSSVFSGECEDNSYVQFLTWRQTKSCQRPLSAFATACTTALNSANYIEKWAVSEDPNPTVRRLFWSTGIRKLAILLRFCFCIVEPSRVLDWHHTKEDHNAHSGQWHIFIRANQQCTTDYIQCEYAKNMY